MVSCMLILMSTPLISKMDEYNRQHCDGGTDTAWSFDDRFIGGRNRKADFDHHCDLRWVFMPFTSVTCSRRDGVGGLTTIVASYLARVRGSGEPENSRIRTKELDHFIREVESTVLDRGWRINVRIYFYASSSICSSRLIVQDDKHAL